MIAILDPALFILDRSEARTADDLEMVVRILRRPGVITPDLSEYWVRLWKELVIPLKQRFGKEVRQAIGELQVLKSSEKMLPPPKSGVSIAGQRYFNEMFERPGLLEGWSTPLQRAMARVVLSGQKCFLVTRLLPGRNTRRHMHDGVETIELTIWRLVLQLDEGSKHQYFCYHHVRNHDVLWTSRYDVRLPAEEDCARYPFCPKAKWWNPSVVALGVKESKRAWIDDKDNGWARAVVTAGRGHHWDVLLGGTCRRELALGHLNVVEYGAPSTEGACGSIHHGVDPKKRWSCR